MSDTSADREGFDFDEVFDWIESYYHVVVVVALAGFMFWNRIRTYDNFIVDGEVMFSGNDAWYHYRQTVYTVEHFPQTMPYDVWTYFPYGNASGQFGTLLDQLMAAAALVVGLGNPDQQTVAMVVLVTPVVLATLAVIPAYFIGRRLGGRFGGVVAVFVIALASGRFLRLSRVGFSDHHVAEALFQAVAVLGIMVALSVAARDKPIYEQLRERDLDALREPLGWAALAGIAVTAYLWVWPYGVLLLGILGTFFVIQLSLEFLRGESPEHTALVGAVAMGVTAVTVLASINVSSITATTYSLLHPLLALGVGGTCVFMALLARKWEARDLPRIGYPVAVVGVLLAGALFMLVALPDLFDYFLNQVLRVVGFSTSPTVGTVGEAQQLRSAGELYDSYGFAILLALAAAAWIVLRAALGRRVAGPELLMVVWLAFLTAATFTQSRFEYYLAVPVAGLTGYAIGNLFRWLNLDFDPSNVEVYQVLAVITAVMVVVVPMLLGSSSALAVGAQNGPSPSSQGWNEALDWMEENTPEEGMYDSDSTELEYYGTYAAQDDFDYEEGAYGVVSWWDYGHWITVMGERIPHANPHQQGSTTAANFLLSPNESQANDVLEGIDEDDAQNRYVMVDWQMVEPTTSVYYRSRFQRTNGKFFAPPNFYDRGHVRIDDYTNTLYHARDSNQDGRDDMLFSFNATNQRYYNTTVARLYHYHGSAMDARPIVLDWSPQTFGGQTLPMTPPDDTNSGRALRVYNSMSEARQYVANDSTSQIGGVGPYPSQDVPALEHYRLVGLSEMSANNDPFARYQVASAS
jgi:dolichyl-diphosphooligosaccharide--protein glycosyltransferase